MRHLFQFEKRHEPIANADTFKSRLVRNGRWALGVITVSMIIGVAGYMGFEGMVFIDAFVNAAMILSGMGPVQPLEHVVGVQRLTRGPPELLGGETGLLVKAHRRSRPSWSVDASTGVPACSPSRPARAARPRNRCVLTVPSATPSVVAMSATPIS